MRRNERYRTLLTQVRGEMERYESYAERTIIQMQTEAGQLGLDGASTALRVAMRGNFQMLPSQPFEFMTGVCADGKPLFALLQERALFPDAVDGMTQALLDGLAFGESPRKVARRMAGGLSAGLSKALVIARTEQIRAYREATRARYAQAGIKQYRRHCALQDRTCLACLDLDGTVQDTEEIVASHPNCRCYTTPEIDGLDLRGGDAQAWFERQSEAKQKEIMGATRWKMWKEGQVGWGDFAKVKDDPVWGPTIGLKPVRDLRENLAIGKDVRLAREGKLFSFLTKNDDVVYSGEIDLSARYGISDLRSSHVVLAGKQKRYIKREHVGDYKWIENNQEILIKAISRPEFYENEPTIAKFGGLNIAQVVSTGDSDLPFLVVVLNFSQSNAKVWSVFRAPNRYLFAGENLKDRWIKNTGEQ